MFVVARGRRRLCIGRLYADAFNSVATTSAVLVVGLRSSVALESCRFF